MSHSSIFIPFYLVTHSLVTCNSPCCYYTWISLQGLIKVYLILSYLNVPFSNLLHDQTVKVTLKVPDRFVMLFVIKYWAALSLLWFLGCDYPDFLTNFFTSVPSPSISCECSWLGWSYLLVWYSYTCVDHTYHAMIAIIIWVN